MVTKQIARPICRSFGMTRPGTEPRPIAYQASILPLGRGSGVEYDRNELKKDREGWNANERAIRSLIHHESIALVFSI